MKTSSSSFFPSLLRVKPRSSSYLFTLLAFILFATIISGHDFLLILHPYPKDQTQTLFFSTPRQFHSFFLFLIIIYMFIASYFVFLVFEWRKHDDGDTNQKRRRRRVWRVPGKVGTRRVDSPTVRGIGLSLHTAPVNMSRTRSAWEGVSTMAMATSRLRSSHVSASLFFSTFFFIILVILK